MLNRPVNTKFDLGKCPNHNSKITHFLYPINIMAERGRVIIMAECFNCGYRIQMDYSLSEFTVKII